MRTQVRKIGNSLGNIILAALIRQLGLTEGAEIDVKVEGTKITIEPVTSNRKRLPLTEKELLKGLSPHTAHADERATLSGSELGE